VREVGRAVEGDEVGGAGHSAPFADVLVVGPHRLAGPGGDALDDVVGDVAVLGPGRSRGPHAVGRVDAAAPHDALLGAEQVHAGVPAGFLLDDQAFEMNVFAVAQRDALAGRAGGPPDHDRLARRAVPADDSRPVLAGFEYQGVSLLPTGDGAPGRLPGPLL